MANRSAFNAPINLIGSKVTSSAISGGPPASPSDGDIWMGLAAGSSGEVWQFRYNAGSASPYKWEFIGGSPVEVQDSTTQTLSATSTWTPMTGMQLTVPRAGDYLFTGSSWGTNSATGAATFELGISQNSTTAPLLAFAQVSTSATFAYLLFGQYKAIAAAASDVFRTLYWQNGAATNNSSYRTFTCVPIRVS